jgi:hypothetical protein
MIRVIFEGLKITLVSIVTLFKEFQYRSDEISDELWREFFNQSPPFPINDQAVAKLFYYLAYITLIAGWIIASYITVWFIGEIITVL